MTLHQLQFLICIADLGSISACAEHYGVTQPTVTNQIHKLEEELSAELLVRSARGATLTSIGAKVVSQAKRVLQEANKIPTLVEESKHSITGKIVLGVSPISPISMHHFPRIYQSFHRDFPEVNIEVIETKALHIADQVRNGQVDLALTPLPLFSTRLQYELLWREELVVISSPHIHLDDSVSMDSLRDHDFVSLKPGFSLTLTIAHLAQKACFEPHITAEVSSINGLIGFVALGLGIAIVPRAAVSLEANAGLIHISRLSPETYRQFAMVFFDRNALSPAVEVLMRYIRSYAHDSVE